MLEVMQDLPSWSDYGPTINDLESYKVSGWNRPTLFWSLKCEAEGKTREQAYEASKTDIGRYTGYMTLRRCGIAFLCIYCLALCAHCCTLMKNPALFFIERMLGDLIFVIITPFVAVAIYGELNSNEENTQKLESFEIF